MTTTLERRHPRVLEPARLRAELQRRRGVSLAAARAVSPKAVEDFRTLLATPALIDLDVMLLEEGIPDDALTEFAAFQDEYQQARRQLIEIGQRMMGFLSVKLERTLDSCFAKRAVGPLIDDYLLIIEMCESQSVPEIHTWFRHNASSQLLNMLLSLMTFYVARLIRKKEKADPKRYTKEKVNTFLTAFTQHYCSKLGRPSLEGGQFYENTTVVTKAIRSVYPASFREIIGQPGLDRPNEELEASAAEKLELIRQMAPLVHFDAYLKTWGDAKLGIYGLSDKITGSAKVEIMYQFRVMLRPGYQHKRKDANISLNEAQSVLNHTSWGESFFDCFMDYITGEISLQKHLPLATVLSAREYLQIKNAFYDAVLQCLDDKTKKLDKASLFPPPVEAEIDQTRLQVTTQLPTGVIEEDSEEFDDQPRVSITRRVREIDENGHEFKRRLNGLKKDRVIRALTAILGPPAENGSSHVVFRNKKGAMSPIALHQEVKTGAIRTLLDRLGITYKKFLDHY